MAPEPNELTDPFFIVGSPRSGTTYLVEVLQKHPKIFITNETRVMTFFSRAVHRVATNRAALDRHSEEFIRFFRLAGPELVRRFYGDVLKAPEGARWGDKNPHYADAKTDPECLSLIDDFFPKSQFIHVVRDGREVVCSIVRKGWSPFKKAIDVWRRHVIHARAFGASLKEGRFLEVRHEDFYIREREMTARILKFLGLSLDPQVSEFLGAQSLQRTPFSGATSDVSKPLEPAWRDYFSKAHIKALEKELGPLLVELGYENAAWWGERSG